MTQESAAVMFAQLAACTDRVSPALRSGPARASSGEAAARDSRLPRAADQGDHVEHLPRLAHLMRTEDACPLPGRNSGRRKSSAQPFIGWGVERFADELLVRQRH